jgi:hypothetical protein
VRDREKRDKICGKERILKRDREKNEKTERKEKRQRKKKKTCSACQTGKVKPCSIFPKADRPADSTHTKLLNKKQKNRKNKKTEKQKNKKNKKTEKQKQNNLRQLSCCCVPKHQNLK